MRLYLDTEFNGFGGELISLALVDEGGKSFYEVRTINSPFDSWVSNHVIPVLDREPVDQITFRLVFHRFIKQYQNPEIICDWHADAEHFCHMLAGSDYGSSLDFACKINLLKTPPGTLISLKPHNALADASALRAWHMEKEKVA